LHQGTRYVPADFILTVDSSGGSQHQQDLAVANCLAQAEALMDGYESGSDEPYRAHPGNRPSNLIMMQRLSPSVLGQLIALYEHKVFVEGVIWGINPFDQFGVELGKRLAHDMLPAVTGATAYTGVNDSTRGLLKRIHGRSTRS
jgi:glucose-6-phosphate isomerase